MKIKLKLLGAALVVAPALLLGSGSALASSVCPGFSGGSADGEGVSAGYTADLTFSAPGVVSGNTGCTVLITFGAGGAVSTSNPNGNGYYDTGGDDNIVGIINNSNVTIDSISLVSDNGDDIFGFDGDGPCDSVSGNPVTGPGQGFTFYGSANPCGAGPSVTLAAGGYGPAGITYTGINSGDTAGTVNFAGGIAPGSTAWFGLEGPANDISGTSVTGTSTGVPEPATLGLAGICVAALGLARRKRKAG
jgi:hypothetical protein